MAAQTGRSMLLKSGTAAAGTTIAALRETSFAINGTPVDVTNKDSGGYRELLAGAGVTSVSISASGVVTDNDDMMTLIGYAKARTLNTFGMVFGDGDKLDGSWQITAYSVSGGFDNEQTFSATFESSGEITFTTV